jgi:Smg protein
MKDNLFEMLLNLFEKTLTQLKESHVSMSESPQQVGNQTATKEETPAVFIRSARSESVRIFSEHEQVKLTKASYQFLVRIASLGVFAPELFESIINQLSFSDSRFVLLQETKWTIRSTLASSLDAEQLAFLDLVLYHKEDGLPLH